MLEEISLQNFKRFDSDGIAIHPRRITVLIGANGTGKSSILQALLLLKQSINHTEIVFTGLDVALGSFRDVAHLQSLSEPCRISLGIRYKMPESFPRSHPHLPHKGIVHYSVAFHNELREQVGSIHNDDHDFLRVVYKAISAPDSSRRVVISGNEDEFVFDLTATGAIGRPFGYSAVSEINPKNMRYWINIMSLVSCVPDTLENISLIPAMRGLTQFSYKGYATSPPSPEDTNGTGTLARTIAAHPELLEDVSQFLREVVGSDYQLRFRITDGQISPEMGRRRLAINLVNEAFGLNQLVMPFVSLIQASPGAIIGIEEPESHLHPKAQTALCRVLVRIANEGPKQLILTTHSEHILTGLLAAVGRGELAANDLAVYELHRDGESTRAEHLAVNEQGQISGGLRGFMDADLEDIGELINMLSKAEQGHSPRISCLMRISSYARRLALIQPGIQIQCALTFSMRSIASVVHLVTIRRLSEFITVNFRTP